MVLQLSGLPEFEARRLVLEITRQLAEAELPGPGRDIPALQLKVSAPANGKPPQLAGLVVAEMLREIRRAP